MESKKSKVKEVHTDISNLRKKIRENEVSAQKLIKAEDTVDLEKLKELQVSIRSSLLSLYVILQPYVSGEN